MDTRRRAALIISAFNEQDSFYLLLLSKYECSKRVHNHWADKMFEQTVGKLYRHNSEPLSVLL